MVKTKCVEWDSLNNGVDIVGGLAKSGSHPDVAEFFNNAFEDSGEAPCELGLIHWIIAAFVENPGLEIEIDAWGEHGESGRFWTNELGVFWGWINTDNIWDNFSFQTGKVKGYTIYTLPPFGMLALLERLYQDESEGQPNGL